MKKIILLLMVLVTTASQAQPVLSTWKQNTNGAVGYNNIPADVQQVFYSANFVYVKCTGIPSYNIGPWAMNPNVPTNQSWVFKITRSPVQNTGTLTTVGGGQIGVFKNGVVAFNAGDAMSYNNLGIWHRNAYYFEGTGFDTSGGHPAPGGAYHYHINMTRLYSGNASQHSPLVGYMFDGFPIYGSYAYSNTNGTGGIRRMKSGYRKRNITARTTLPDGTVLQASQYGPAINSTYPLGCFYEDWETYSGGDLDAHNGRIAVTPEYPSGIYAYYLTIDSLGNPEYPYLIGPTYYGVVTAGNAGPGGGHVTISETVTQYFPTSVTGNETPVNFTLYQNYPNPFNPETTIKFDLSKAENVSLKVFDLQGKEVAALVNEKMNTGSYSVKFNGTNLSSGVYYYTLKTSESSVTNKMLLVK
ncbi:MAG: YHYH protein [Bacteroidetes bacterium]|nr:YHYH protein [Bacteroidota bacterium]